MLKLDLPSHCRCTTLGSVVQSPSHSGEKVPLIPDWALILSLNSINNETQQLIKQIPIPLHG